MHAMFEDPQQKMEYGDPIFFFLSHKQRLKFDISGKKRLWLVRYTMPRYRHHYILIVSNELKCYNQENNFKNRHF